MDLEFDDGAFRGIKDGFPDAKIAQTKGIYQEPHTLEFSPQICLIGIRYGEIENERIRFCTRRGEFVDLKLNCRENLVLCTSPVVLQMRELADENDVGDVAVVKIGESEVILRNQTYQAVCEGLILSKCIIRSQ